MLPGVGAFARLQCLVTRLKYPPIVRQVQQYPCRTVFLVASQAIAATPPLLSVKVAYHCPKTGLTRGASQKKLASEAYRAIGGVARNSIANRAAVMIGRLAVPKHCKYWGKS